MGFGYGGSSRTVRGGKSYNNAMTAHAWNSGNAERGQSSNGNFYFNGAALYSYGSHFVVAYRMPDGTVFMNSDSYSVSTSGHQSDMRAAIDNRPSVSVSSLTDLAGDWKLLPRLARYLREGPASDKEARDAMRASVAAALLAHADDLRGQVYPAGESRHSNGHYDSEARQYVYAATDYPEAGEYLANLVGLRAGTWNRIKRDADAAKAKRAAAKIADDKRAAESRALRLADMPARDFRDALNRASDGYNDSSLVSIGKELKRARGLMLKATSGKLAAKSRLATIRERIKETTHYVNTYSARHAKRDAARREYRELGVVKAWRDCQNKLANTNSYAMRELSSAGEYLAQYGRTSAIRASGAELNRLAYIGQIACEAERERLAELAEAERAAERERAKLEKAERIRLWLAGERVGAISFDAESGGAALRIMGETLETSHGAEVPLAHAVKVFRFVKLCRDSGKAWQRNGRTIRVGLFQVDSVSASGDFVAGCHRFTWSEVERVAKLAGVFDCPASDAALESSGHASAA
jgi:hypothetical protein